jgi:hypothetical protein
MTAIRKMRIHGFGGKEVLLPNDIEPSLPDAAKCWSPCAASVDPVDFETRAGKYPGVKDDRLPYTLGRLILGRRPMRGRRRNCRQR